MILNDYTKNRAINQYFANQKEKQIEDYKVQFIKISNENNLSAYIIVLQNLKTIAKARKDKKANNANYEIVFAGLRQPTKNISMDTYDVLSKFIKRFKIFEMDICFDGENQLEVNYKNLNKYLHIFDDYIAFKKDAEMYFSSFYINTPQSVENDADRFLKMILYDKYIKENRKSLDASYKNWRRLESTISVNSKLKDFMIDDSMLDVLNIAENYFNMKEFSVEYIYLQITLLTNRRTHNSKEKIKQLNTPLKGL